MQSEPLDVLFGGGPAHPVVVIAYAKILCMNFGVNVIVLRDFCIGSSLYINFLYPKMQEFMNLYIGLSIYI